MTGTLIVSTGRCGYTLISDLMNLHGKVLSLSEFHTMVGPGLLLAPDMDGRALWEKMCFVSQQSKDLMRLAPCSEILADISGGEPYPEPLELITIPHLERAGLKDVRLSFQIATEARAAAPIAEHFAPIFDYMRDRYQRDCWVERSGATMDYLHLLLPCYPDARIIHIYRDSPETALSMSRHPYFKMRAVYSRVRPMPVEEALSFDLPLAEFGRYWSDMMVKGLKALEDDGRPVLHLSYEALGMRPRANLRDVFAFMELPVVDLDRACAIIRPAQFHRGPPEWGDLIEACQPGVDALREAVA